MMKKLLIITVSVMILSLVMSSFLSGQESSGETLRIDRSSEDHPYRHLSSWIVNGIGMGISTAGIASAFCSYAEDIYYDAMMISLMHVPGSLIMLSADSLAENKSIGRANLVYGLIEYICGLAVMGTAKYMIDIKHDSSPSIWWQVSPVVGYYMMTVGTFDAGYALVSLIKNRNINYRSPDFENSVPFPERNPGVGFLLTLFPGFGTGFFYLGYKSWGWSFLFSQLIIPSIWILSGFFYCATYCDLDFILPLLLHPGALILSSRIVEFLSFLILIPKDKSEGNTDYNAPDDTHAFEIEGYGMNFFPRKTGDGNEIILSPQMTIRF